MTQPPKPKPAHVRLAFDGGTYEPTHVDRLWLLRAVQVEGPPQPMVARALVNGFCWARARRRYGGQLMTWVRAYAQPVNPRWFPEGDLLARFCANLPAPDLARERRAAELRQTVHSECVRFSPRVGAAVRDALETPYAGDVTDYAAFWINAAKKGYELRSEPMKGSNTLWTRDATWKGYRVVLCSNASP